MFRPWAASQSSRGLTPGLISHMMGINPAWTSRGEKARGGGEPQAAQGTAVFRQRPRGLECLGGHAGRMHEAREGRVGFLPQSSVFPATWPGRWGAQRPEALLGLSHASGSRAPELFPLVKSYVYLFIVTHTAFSQVSLGII